ncbi:MAG: SpoIID/LytB domain-containing protein [Candidatus Obscuribacterales bacterium]|nr:SpoIID/LytB domain-containing protein [Candidatus Obscuribacterales bacterium]
MGKSDIANEDEAAAALAAVAFYCSAKKKIEPAKKQESSWLATARLEACQLKQRTKTNKGSLWRWSTLATLFFCLTTAPVSAAESQIKVALAVNTTGCDIVVPDGAEIVDRQTAELVAELPPQSRWHISVDNNLQNRTKQLTFAGLIGNMSLSQVLLAKIAGVYPDTNTSAFMTGLSGQDDTNDHGGFKQAPILIEDLHPHFALATSREAASLSSKTATYRPVVYGVQAPSLPTNFPLSGYVLRPLNPEGIFGFNGKFYRGQLFIDPKVSDGKTFTAVNLVNLEDYLLSVVPTEMPANWNSEALKAQAIAARSYALANIGKHIKEGFDVKATTEDQVYSGIASENSTTNSAVAATKGLVMKHRNQVVSAFFHSSAGGFTDLADNVWAKNLTYIKSVPDFDDQSPHFNWKRQFATAEVEERLLKSGINIGALLGVFPLSRSDAQRVKYVLISGSLQTLVVSGEEFRNLLALPSSLFHVSTQPEKYHLNGRGFGHGLGLSQWGAKYLGDNGYNAAQILSYYYKDISIEPLF